jgi:non-lysosomal glucosylceramidase
MKLAWTMCDQELIETYQSWLVLGRQNYENKLWTGSYYKIDTGSNKENNLWIMADQLCGQWYATACGLPGIVSDDHAVKAYRSIYENNFKKFNSGKIGPVNVIYPNGKLDTLLLQTHEVWIGVAWSVPAGMLQQGMDPLVF